MGDWLDLHAVYVNEWMRRKWLEYDMSYNVYVHYMPISRQLQTTLHLLALGIFYLNPPKPCP